MKLRPEIHIPPGLRPLLRDIKTIFPSDKNARTHKKGQIKALALNAEKLGYNSAIAVDREGRILAGHARYAAALLLGMTHVPVIVLDTLTEAQKRCFMLGDNQLATLSGWDRGILAEDFAYLNGELPSLGITFADLGFAVGEVNAVSEDRGNILGGDPADALPKPAKVIVTKTGQIWRLGPLEHRVMCGDARSVDELVRLLAGALAAMCFVDKPYNVPVDGHIQGNGGIQHDEFAMASGEMSPAEFRAFAKVTDEVIRAGMKEGGLVYSCIDWRSLPLFMEVGLEVFGSILNIIVWNKTNAGQGSFYRSQHEFIPLFKLGDAAHTNAVELGKYGRNRSNVWTYPGANTFRKGRMADLAAHPTVKPVAMVADAIRDCTLPGEIVLDTFLGSGTTLLAAEKVGRRCMGIEIEPKFVDVAIRRWQDFTGLDAICAVTGRTFDEIAADLSGKPDSEG
jgi:DNA modification methylase